MPVSISVGLEGEPSLAVPTSPLSSEELMTKGAPSTRQKTSVSSFSTRLHVGQRFIKDLLGQNKICSWLSLHRSDTFIAGPTKMKCRRRRLKALGFQAINSLRNKAKLTPAGSRVSAIL